MIEEWNRSKKSASMLGPGTPGVNPVPRAEEVRPAKSVLLNFDAEDPGDTIKK